MKQIGAPPCPVGARILLGPDGPLEGTLGCAEFDAAAAEAAREVLAAGDGRPVTRTFHHDLGDVEVFVDPHLAPPALVVVSATPVALALLRLGRGLGYRTILVEPRGARILPAHRAEAEDVVASVGEVALDDRTDVVHTDHDAPDVAGSVAAVLRAPTRFIGVMGSKRHVGPYVEALRAMGFSQDDLARVRSPVGIDLGATSRRRSRSRSRPASSPRGRVVRRLAGRLSRLLLRAAAPRPPPPTRLLASTQPQAGPAPPRLRRVPLGRGDRDRLVRVAAVRRTTRRAADHRHGKAIVTTQNPIKHVIFIVKENRTFNNYFATYGHGAVGTTTGKTITCSTSTHSCQPGDDYQLTKAPGRRAARHHPRVLLGLVLDRRGQDGRVQHHRPGRGYVGIHVLRPRRAPELLEVRRSLRARGPLLHVDVRTDLPRASLHGGGAVLRHRGQQVDDGSSRELLRRSDRVRASVPVGVPLGCGSQEDHGLREPHDERLPQPALQDLRLLGADAHVRPHQVAARRTAGGGHRLEVLLGEGPLDERPPGDPSRPVHARDLVEGPGPGELPERHQERRPPGGLLVDPAGDLQRASRRLGSQQPVLLAHLRLRGARTGPSTRSTP